MTEKLNEKQPEQERYVSVFIAIHNFFRYLSRFWWLVVISALVCSVLAFEYTFHTFNPVYRSEATFMVTTTNTDELDGSGYTFSYDLGSAEQLSLTFPHILTSEIFRDAIKKELGADSVNGSISANVIPKSNVITMYVTSSDPYDAQKVLEAAIKVCPDVARFVIGETKFTFIDKPTLPTKPNNVPEYTKNVFMSCAAGSLIILLPLIILSVFRNAVHREDDIQNSISIPRLATLIKHRRKKKSKSISDCTSLITPREDYFMAEKFETLRIRMEKELGGDKNVLMVTSTLPREGKSFVSLNLAYYLAKHEKKVLLVDGDIRKQNLWKSVSNEGYSYANPTISDFPEVFASINPSEDMPINVTFNNSTTSFDFIGGRTPENLVSGLISQNLQKLVKRFKNEYDYVIVDTPPALGCEDVILINDFCDALLYVVRYDYAYKSKVIESLSVLKEAEADIIGYVFNGISVTSDNYGKYNYNRYGYGKYGYGKYGYGYGRYGADHSRKEDENSVEQQKNKDII